jgi:hypothetical protein
MIYPYKIVKAMVHMKKLLKNIVKGAVIMFAVGAALALAAPYLAAATGIAPSVAEAVTTLGANANPLWLGSFFGAFGAISAAVTPVCNYIFDGKERREAAQAAKEETKPVIMVVTQKTSEPVTAAFRDAVKASREQNSSSPQR